MQQQQLEVTCYTFTVRPARLHLLMILTPLMMILCVIHTVPFTNFTGIGADLPVHETSHMQNFILR